MTRPRIATVYRDDPYDEYPTVNMAMIRWLRISQELARSGADVDMIVNVRAGPRRPDPGVRFVPFVSVRWRDYDVVKALYQRGFDTLGRHGGGDHPFVVGSIATVVGRRDGVPGVQVMPAERAALWETQVRMARKCRWISVRTAPNQVLWEREFPGLESPLLVPTGVDRNIPTGRFDPYRGLDAPVALYVGNLARGTAVSICASSVLPVTWCWTPGWSPASAPFPTMPSGTSNATPAWDWPLPRAPSSSTSAASCTTTCAPVSRW